MTLWAAKYIGIPFVDGGRDMDGCDCWGLVRMVLRDRANIDLPSYSGIAAEDGRAVRDEIRRSALSDQWVEIEQSQALPLDVVEMRGRVDTGGLTRSAVTHLGIVVDRNKLMHVEDGTNVIIQPFNGPLVRERIRRFFRHRRLT